MGNKWREVWEKRDIDEGILRSGDYKEIFMALKRMNGFDVMDRDVRGGVGFEEFYGQYRKVRSELEYCPADKSYMLGSIFEVGCGSGANLYLFQRDGLAVGGLDYSKAQIEAAGKVLENPRELVCDEAVRLSVEEKYDAVLSNSVFSYFEDYEYALKVLECMYQKANYSMGIIDIHDVDRKDDFIEYRNRVSGDYEQRYKDLPKLFYDRAFFLKFAQKHGLDIKFQRSDVEGYWNNDFVFNCFFWK